MAYNAFMDSANSLRNLLLLRQSQLLGHSVVYYVDKTTNVSKEHIASIFRIE
jgi:hypothetical protein